MALFRIYLDMEIKADDATQAAKMFHYWLCDQTDKLLPRVKVTNEDNDQIEEFNLNELDP